MTRIRVYDFITYWAWTAFRPDGKGVRYVGYGKAPTQEQALADANTCRTNSTNQ